MEQHTKIEVNHSFLYVQHLGVADERELMDFTVEDPRGQGLQNYIRFQALADEKSGVMRTYVVRFKGNDQIIAYFSLKAGLISHNELPLDTGNVFETLPGIELANFAVNSALSKRYGMKGVGYVVFSHFILPMVEAISRMVGVKLVYIFALPYERLIKRYEEYNFQRLPKNAEAQLHARLKPAYDEGCIFMYQLIDEGVAADG